MKDKVMPLAELKALLKIDVTEPAWVAEERAKLDAALEAIEAQYPKARGKLVKAS